MKPQAGSFEPPADWFGCWWDPERLLNAVRRHNEAVPAEEQFGRPELKPLSEAYAAAMFGTIRSQSAPCSIRLIRDGFPDFELRFAARVDQFELTEADREGRRRGDEYREAAALRAMGLRPTPEAFDPLEQQRAALPAAALAIQRKAAKHYRPAPHLLVYVNFFLFG
jgi:hypothetical protein